MSSEEKRRVRQSTKHPVTGKPTKYDSLISRIPHPGAASGEERFKKAEVSPEREVESRIELIEETAKSELGNAGFPDDLHPLNYLGLVNREIPSPEASIANAYAETFFLKEALKKNQTSEAARQAMRMEGHFMEWFIFQIEHAARVGEKQLNSAYESQYSESEKQEWENTARQLFDSDPSLQGQRKQRALAKRVAELAAAKEETIRAHFKEKRIPAIWVEG